MEGSAHMVKKIFCLILVLAVVPAFFFIYQPSLRLEWIGLLIGYAGMSLTPLAIIYLLYYYIRNEWK